MKHFLCKIALTGLLLALALGPMARTGIAQPSNNITIAVPYRDRVFVGKPLVWDGKEMLLLRRNGAICTLPVTSDDDYRKRADSFEPYSKQRIRERLQKEFGRKYQVSLTQHFVVVHPPGDYQTWAMPFETLFQRFEVYFKSRSLTIEPPQFPMIAVVLRTRNEFDRMLRAANRYDSKILGYYSPRSNRVITYDQTEATPKNPQWFFNADTIIHEATHQTAFNTGIHNRFGPVPRWVSEGLAMLFEAPGVNNSLAYSRRQDRINRTRLIELKKHYERGAVKGRLADLITDDTLFRTDPSLAYAMAWGLTFYLTEKMPQEYIRFLQADRERPPFAAYPPKARAKAFAAEFGPEIDNLEARMKHFIMGLKTPR